MRWVASNMNEYKWEGDAETIISIANSLDTLTSKDIEETSFTGKLIMASLKGNFEIETQGSIVYRGLFPLHLTKEIRKLHLGDTCSGTIEKETILNKTTGYEKTSYTLLTIKVISETPPHEEIELLLD